MDERKHLYLWICVTVLLFLMSCTSPSPPQARPKNTRPEVRIGSPTLSPPTPIIGALPRDCPVSHPVRHTISSAISSVIGASPVWAAWIPGPNIFHLTPPPHSPYPSSYLPPYGWDLTKVVWEVGPDYHQQITVRGYELSDHTPLFFQFLSETPTTTVVLDPQHPDHPVSVIGTNWAEWGSDLVVPKAGCYVMQVSWPTGGWTLTFTVGA